MNRPQAGRARARVQATQASRTRGYAPAAGPALLQSPPLLAVRGRAPAARRAAAAPPPVGGGGCDPVVIWAPDHACARPHLHQLDVSHLGGVAAADLCLLNVSAVAL